LEEELQQAFSPQTDIELLPGSGGVFRVCADGKQVFSKKEAGRFPEPGEVVSLLKTST
jgi:selenoprotein W-related protein